MIDRLSEITAPTLVISGKKDYADFINNGEILWQNLLNIRVEIIKDASHMVNLEFPDKVDKLIEDFILQ